MDGKQKLSLTFAFYQGDQLVRRESIAQDIIKVGKDPKSHLRVDDELAGRMHAVIEMQDDVTLIDLGSESGTLVNGARVNKCKLNQGDQLQIGSTLIVLERIEVAVAAAAGLGTVPAATTVPFAQASNPFAVQAPGASNPFAAGTPLPAVSNPFAAAPMPSIPNPFASNPFAAQAPSHTPHAHGHAHGAGANAAEGSYEYQIVKGGMPVRSDEVETAASAIEVRVLWGRNLLHIAHLSPVRSFYVGESAGKGNTVDYTIPQAKLGASRIAIVEAAGGSAVAVVPPNAGGWVEAGNNQGRTPLQQAAQGGRVALNSGTSVRI